MVKKPEWPADKIERRAVSDLLPYARNARTHSKEQVDQIAASIGEWGWTVPVLVDENDMIIAGHGRILAAQKLDIETVPVMTAVGWSEAQKKAYVLADNKLAENASWDIDALKIEIMELQDLEFDLPVMGFTDEEVSKMFAGDEEAGDPETHEESTPEIPLKGVTEPGDVWKCGEHEIIAGEEDLLTVDNLVVWWQEHYGEEAILKGVGKTFALIAKERLAPDKAG